MTGSRPQPDLVTRRTSAVGQRGRTARCRSTPVVPDQLLRSTVWTRMHAVRRGLAPRAQARSTRAAAPRSGTTARPGAGPRGPADTGRRGRRRRGRTPAAARRRRAGPRASHRFGKAQHHLVRAGCAGAALCPGNIRSRPMPSSCLQEQPTTGGRAQRGRRQRSGAGDVPRTRPARGPRGPGGGKVGGVAGRVRGHHDLAREQPARVCPVGPGTAVLRQAGQAQRPIAEDHRCSRPALRGKAAGTRGDGPGRHGWIRHCRRAWPPCSPTTAVAHFVASARRPTVRRTPPPGISGPSADRNSHRAARMACPAASTRAGPFGAVPVVREL